MTEKKETQKKKPKYSKQENLKPPVPKGEQKPNVEPTLIVPKEEEFPQSKAIAITGFAKPLVTVAEASAAFEQYQQLTKALMKTSDVVSITTRGVEKTLIKKTGLNKIAKFFGISVEIIRVNKDDFIGPQGGKGFTWKVWAKAIAPNGQFRVAGAACSTRERMFAHQDHDVLATAETRAKKRAIEELAGMGEYDSYEEYKEEEVSESTQAPKTPSERQKSDKKASPVKGLASDKYGPATDKQKNTINVLMEKLSALGLEYQPNQLIENMTVERASTAIKDMTEKGKQLKKEQDDAGLAPDKVEDDIKEEDIL